MKIGILTQPLHNNYGGLLQAYALQHFLLKQGHNVFTIDFNDEKEQQIKINQLIRDGIKKYILKRPSPLTKKEKLRISQHTSHFIAEYIRKTQYISDLDEFSYLKQYQFDAYIVGSDQVWRPLYSPGMPAFFLNFLKDDDNNTKRIAYAASFGVEHCNEFSKEELQDYSRLAQKFNAIGVREDSAIALCTKYLSVDAELVLDPTLLLDKSEYIKLINNSITTPSNGNTMTYILDKSDEKSQIIDLVSKHYKAELYSIMPHDDGVYPPVTQWLRGFLDANFIVTDSFHGVVFSIIFNKQFIAIGNKSRGLARFLSILKLFNLEDRLVFSIDELSKVFDLPPIDFIRVNTEKEKLINKSTSFIANALSGIKNND